MYCPDFAIFAVQLKLSAKPGDAAAQPESGKPQEVMAQEQHR
jgi:hypothetical protein